MGEHLWSQELRKGEAALPVPLVRREGDAGWPEQLWGSAAAGLSAELQHNPSRSVTVRCHVGCPADELGGGDAHLGEMSTFR